MSVITKLFRAAFDFSNQTGAGKPRPLVNGGMFLQQADAYLETLKPDGSSRRTDLRPMTEQLGQGPLHDMLVQYIRYADLPDGGAGAGISVPVPAKSLKANLLSTAAPAQDVSLATLAAPGNPLGDAIAARTTKAYVDSAIQAIVGMSPADLDTLAEIAARIVGDEGTVAALTGTVAGKLAKASNLSDLTNPASARSNLGLTIGTTVQAYDADLDAIAALATTSFGRSFLALVDASSAVALIGAASLASPTFTGTPTAPTPISTDNSQKLATTAFVVAAIAAGGGSATAGVRRLSDFAGAEADDTAAVQRAFAWALAGSEDRAIVFPPLVKISAMCGGTIAGTKKLIMNAGAGTTRFEVANGTDGLKFTREYGAGFNMIGRFEIIRIAPAGTEANTGLRLDYTPVVSLPSVNAGSVIIDHLECSGNIGTASQNGWKIGCKMTSVCNLVMNSYISHGVNYVGNSPEDPSAGGYDPENYSSGLWFHGANTTNFMIGCWVGRMAIQGYSASWRLTGAQQGITCAHADIIGGNYGLFAPFKPSDLAEEVRMSAGSFNSALKNVYVAECGGVYIDNGIHLRFASSNSRPWTAIEFNNNVEYAVSNQKGHGGFTGSGSITPTNIEIGFLDSSTGGAKSGNGTILGMGIDSLYGPEIKLVAGVANKTFGQFSAAGVNGGLDIGSPLANFNTGGMLNGAYVGDYSLARNLLTTGSNVSDAEIIISAATTLVPSDVNKFYTFIQPVVLTLPNPTGLGGASIQVQNLVNANAGINGPTVSADFATFKYLETVWFQSIGGAWRVRSRSKMSVPA